MISLLNARLVEARPIIGFLKALDPKHKSEMLDTIDSALQKRVPALQAAISDWAIAPDEKIDELNIATAACITLDASYKARASSVQAYKLLIKRIDHAIDASQKHQANSATSIADMYLKGGAYYQTPIDAGFALIKRQLALQRPVIEACCRLDPRDHRRLLRAHPQDANLAAAVAINTSDPGIQKQLIARFPQTISLIAERALDPSVQRRLLEMHGHDELLMTGMAPYIHDFELQTELLERFPKSGAIAAAIAKNACTENTQRLIISLHASDKAVVLKLAPHVREQDIQSRLLQVYPQDDEVATALAPHLYDRDLLDLALVERDAVKRRLLSDNPSCGTISAIIARAETISDIEMIAELAPASWRALLAAKRRNVEVAIAVAAAIDDHELHRTVLSAYAHDERVGLAVGQISTHPLIQRALIAAYPKNHAVLRNVILQAHDTQIVVDALRGNEKLQELLVSEPELKETTATRLVEATSSPAVHQALLKRFPSSAAIASRVVARTVDHEVLRSALLAHPSTWHAALAAHSEDAYVAHIILEELLEESFVPILEAFPHDTDIAVVIAEHTHDAATQRVLLTLHSHEPSVVEAVARHADDEKIAHRLLSSYPDNDVIASTIAMHNVDTLTLKRILTERPALSELLLTCKPHPNRALAISETTKESAIQAQLLDRYPDNIQAATNVVGSSKDPDVLERALRLHPSLAQPMMELAVKNPKLVNTVLELHPRDAGMRRSIADAYPGNEEVAANIVISELEYW